MLDEKWGATHFITPDALNTFLQIAKPGDTLIYAIGDLAFDCYYAAPTAPLPTLRSLVWLAHRSGKIFLTQRRVTTSAFAYIATRRDDTAPTVIHLAEWRDAKVSASGSGT